MILSGFWSNPKAVFALLEDLYAGNMVSGVFEVLGKRALGRFWTYRKLLRSNVKKHAIYTTISRVLHGDWTYRK